jgi:hypothetical protein
MAEYSCNYDRVDEPLITINTYSNKEQNWKGEDDWDIQIHYTNFYNTEVQNLEIVIQCGATIMEYETFKDKKKDFPDLYHHYKNFKFYAKPKIYEQV